MARPRKPPPTPPNRLDIIGTDRLLWTLGGFAPADMGPSEPRVYRDKYRILEAWQIRRIVKLADHPVRQRRPDVVRFAEANGFSPRCLYVMIHRVRAGTEPRSWRRVLEALQ